MAIIRFGFKPSEVPEGAQNVKASHRGAGYAAYPYTRDENGEVVEAAGPTALYTWETHVGLCLYDYERNGYDDSDFHMVVWNPERQEPENICFASTRGWSYPAYNSYADATDEVKAAYKAWEARRDRKLGIGRKLERRRTRNTYARVFEVRPSHIRRLEQAYKPVDVERLLKLAESFKAGRLKNAFRKKLAAQVLAWVEDPAPRYPTPLSAKQFQYV